MDSRVEFDASIELLFAAYGSVASDLRRDAYWKTLAKMSQIDFQRAIEHCLSEEAPERLPTAQSLWVIAKRLRPARAPGALEWKPPVMDAWQAKASRYLLEYIRLKVFARPRRYGSCNYSQATGAVAAQSMIERTAVLVRAKNAWVSAMRDDPKRSPAKSVALWEELMRRAEIEIDEFVAEEREAAAPVAQEELL